LHIFLIYDIVLEVVIFMNLNEFQFKKSFGQNFIKEKNIIEKIINVSNIPDNALIIEIGPGAGSLTEKLVKTGNSVLCYEIDIRLKSYLENKFKDNSNIDFIFSDFLTCDVSIDIKNYKYDYIYVIANLPYYITTPIINKLIEEIDVDKMVLMVQKEVGERFTASPNSRDYGSLSVFLQSYFDVKQEFLVSRNCFVPKPNVDSVIVSLTKKQNQFDIRNREVFEKLIRDSFQFKRKTLRNNLKGYPLEQIELILRKYNHDLSSRAEVISIIEFVEISNILKNEA